MKNAIHRNRQWIAGSFASVAILALLVACEASVHSGPPIPQEIIPEGLKDCDFHRLSTEHGQVIHVIRCPGSSTSAGWRAGKSNYYSATIDNAAASAPLPPRDEHNARVDALLKMYDEEIARLEAKKKELK